MESGDLPVMLRRPMTSSTRSGPHHSCGVFVDADPEQRRILGDDRQQAAEPVPLLEMLVDDHAGQDAEAGGHLDHALPGRRATGPECDHVRALIAEAPALVPATTAPSRWRRLMAWASGVPPIVDDEAAAGCRRSGRRRSPRARGGRRSGRSIARGSWCGSDVRSARAELGEDAPIHLARKRSQRGRRRDNRDPSVTPAGEFHEAREDDPLAPCLPRRR